MSKINIILRVLFIPLMLVFLQASVCSAVDWIYAYDRVQFLPVDFFNIITHNIDNNIEYKLFINDILDIS